MQNRGKANAAVAAAALVLGLIGAFWSRVESKAYAIEQTIEALRGVRSVHVRQYSSAQLLETETWISSNERGQVIAVRGQRPDGTVVVASGESAHIWQPARNTLTIESSAAMIGEVQGKLVAGLDPEYWVRTYQDNPNIKLQIDQPKQNAQLIQIVATYINTPGRERTVMQVDPDTKLLKEWSQYSQVEGQYRLLVRFECSDFNQPIDADMFTLQAPAGAVVNDRTKATQAAPEPQPDALASLQPGEAVLPSAEAEEVKEVVRQFVDALMSRDYEKAAGLRGRPAYGIKAWWEGNNMEYRILSFGEVTGGADADGRYANVAFTLQVLRPAPPGYPSYATGERITEEWKKTATLLEDPKQPGKWVICGGL